MQVYQMRLRNAYLGDKMLAIPAKDEIGARALAVRLNTGYEVAECTVYDENGRPTDVAPAGGVELTDDLFGDE